MLEQLSQVQARQSMVLQSFLSSKEKMIEQTGQITQSIAAAYIEQKGGNLLPPSPDVKRLPPSVKANFS